MKYILAIDGGSQSTKLIIFDTHGNIICEESEPLRPMSLPKVGWVEHPDDDLWTSLVTASQRLMERFEGDPSDIVGAGLCSIRFDRVILKKDGTLAQPALSWMDSRVSVPYVHDNPEAAYVTSTNGYLTRRLTGECRDTAATYQGQWPIDTDTWEWSNDGKVMSHYNIPREMLFDLVMPGEILGYLTAEAASILHLPKGLPIVATSNDKAVESLGTGTIDYENGMISLGTYICGAVHGESNPKDCRNYWVNFACMPHKYLYESNGIRRGMWLISWFKELLGEEVRMHARELGIGPEQYLETLAADVAPGSDGLMIIPEWLAPAGQPYKKGIMRGFDVRHGAGHIYRAIMESIAMTMKNRMDEMCAELGITLKQITVSGGGSNSNLFMQIFADVFGVPAVRNVVNGAAAVGAAICVAVAAGIYPDFGTAAKEMVRVKDITDPIPAHAGLYKKINEGIYSSLTSVTDGLMKRAYDIFDGN